MQETAEKHMVLHVHRNSHLLKNVWRFAFTLGSTSALHATILALSGGSSWLLPSLWDREQWYYSWSVPWFSYPPNTPVTRLCHWFYLCSLHTWRLSKLHLSEKARPRFYTKSPTVQGAFCRIIIIAGYIHCTGVTGRWGLLSHRQNAVRCVALRLHAWTQFHDETLPLRCYYCTVWIRPATWLCLSTWNSTAHLLVISV